MAVPAERVLMQKAMSARASTHAGWSALHETTQATYIRRMERSCCTHVITTCERDGIDRLFTDKRFRDRYSASTARVLSCLGHGSALIDGIIDGTIDCADVATIEHVKMCPEAGQAERAMIERRCNQKFELKVSRLYRCRKCGGNETIPIDYQSRAADEAATRSVKCVKCFHVQRE